MQSALPRPVPAKLSELHLTIETPNLRLRPFRDSDAEAIWPIVSDPQLVPFLTWATHRDVSETSRFIKASQDAIAANTGVAWAIEHEGAAVGCIALDDVRWEFRAVRVDRAQLGYWLSPDLWNRGLMTEAATAVVRFGFDSIGLHKITTQCAAANHGSRRVIEKVGFRYVGRAEDDVWRDGQWMTRLLYELTSPEWPDVHTTIRVVTRSSPA